MSATNSLHYKLCCEGGKWLHKTMIIDNKDHWIGTCNIVAIEIVTASVENPDVWGLSGGNTVVIEVKTSRSDFLHDKKKLCRQNKNWSCGNYKYYLVPKGLISKDEVPDNWGLLEWNEGKIELIKRPEFIESSGYGDLSILSSIARREGVKNKIYNYRKINEEE